MAIQDSELQEALALSLLDNPARDRRARANAVLQSLRNVRCGESVFALNVEAPPNTTIFDIADYDDDWCNTAVGDYEDQWLRESEGTRAPRSKIRVMKAGVRAFYVSRCGNTALTCAVGAKGWGPCGTSFLGVGVMSASPIGVYG